LTNNEWRQFCAEWLSTTGSVLPSQTIQEYDVTGNTDLFTMHL